MKNFNQVIMATVLGILITLALALGPRTVHAQTLDPTIDYRYAGEVVRDGAGNTARSPKVISAFKKQWACPVSGKHSGACPGWAIDHIIPLDCGGRDAVFNMQWLPDEIKSAPGEFSKDHFERRVYGGNNLSAGCK